MHSDTFTLTQEELDILRDSGYSEEDINNFVKIKNEKKIVDSCVCHSNTCANTYDFSKLPDISKLDYVPIEDNFYEIKYRNKPVEFQTPILYLPFGIDKYYKDWSLKFELINRKCEGFKEFEEFLYNIEKSIISYLNIIPDNFNSQITSKKGNTYFYGKIRCQTNICEIRDKRSNTSTSLITIYKFPKKVNVIAKIRLGNIWMDNNKYYYKLNVTALQIV